MNNNIPDGWKETIISDVADVNELSVGNDYPYQQIEYIDISSVGTREVLSTQKLNLADAPSRAKRIIRDNDILISTVRPNLKHFCYINKAKPNHVASTGFAVISSKKCNPVFLYYLLTTNAYTDFLIKIADSQTSTYPAFNSGVISNSILAFPPLPEQKAIADVLSSFDNKIELLREQNKTLEAIAQTIFNEWFVRFNFPDENGKPFQASGGKMIDSQLGPIPDGWRVGKMGEVVKICGGSTPDTTESSYWNGSINWTSPKDLSIRKELFLTDTDSKITMDGLKQISSGLLPKGTLLLSSRAPIGYLAITDILVAINQGYIAFLPKAYLSNEFMFIWLKNNIDKVLACSNGSTFLEISKRSLRTIELIVPSREGLYRFQKNINPLFSKIHNNQSKIQTLSALRDELLPKLLKGEIRVKGV